MSQPEKKLEKFSSAVLKDAQEQRDKILKEIDDYRAEQMDKAEEDILHEAYVMIQNEIAAIKNRQSRQISLAELEGRRKLLKLREELSSKVFQEAAAKILEYTNITDYKAKVCDTISRCCKNMPEGEIVIEVKKDDLGFADEFIAASGRKASIRENAAIVLGGVIVYNADQGLIVDETLDLKLSGQRDWFASASGLSIGL